MRSHSKWQSGLWHVLVLGLGLGIAADDAPPILSFELRDVKLADSTFQAKTAASNTEYVLDMLDPDRLLWTFRKQAGLPTPGTPYTGWEAPNCELRGHFTGHYLSTIAMLAHAGDKLAQQRVELMVTELGKVQAAIGTGYLSAFPTEHFDRLEALKGVWAPYYVIHKIMMGLVDAHVLAGNKKALQMASDMADYFYARTSKVILTKGLKHWWASLETEFGGMNEVLYRLYRLTNLETHLQLAKWFEKPKFWAGLIAGRDELAYAHSNTHLAQVVGFAERYDTLKDPDALRAVSSFFDIILANHSFATGGNNYGEHWFPAATLGDAIVQPDKSQMTQEICSQYNMLKIARSLFRFTGSVEYLDYYERALVNGILGVSRLSTDEVVTQEEDNMQLLDRLLHRAHHHDHHDHHHDGGDIHQASHVLYELHSGGQSVGAAGQQPGGGGAAHGQGQQSGHVHQEGTRQAAQSGPASTLTWGSAGGADQPVLGGSLDSSYVYPTHFFRAGAAARTDPAVMHAASMADEPSLLAEYTGKLHHPLVPPVSPGNPSAWVRTANYEYMNFVGHSLVGVPHDDAINVPGTPGSFMYFLNLGIGRAKKDNIHHWGYPFHHFWCCYGTAIESFAKLADSLYFWSPGTHVTDPKAGLGQDQQMDSELPTLYVAQYVSSSLSWKELGVRLTVNATMYAPGPGMSARLVLSDLPDRPAELKGVSEVAFTMKLRIPLWVKSKREQIECQVSINDKLEDTSMVGQGDFHDITRRWKAGDVVSVSCPYLYWLSPVRDLRPQFASVQAIMMGPYVMAGLTHDSFYLQLPTSDLAKVITEPEAPTWALVSLQAKGNSSLFLRHDHYMTYTSVMQDSGDAMDATFALKSGCEPGAAYLRPSGLQAGQVVVLEAMNQPGFLLGVQQSSSRLVWEQLPGGTEGRGMPPNQQDEWCRRHSWRVGPGLDTLPDGTSFELVGQPGSYLTSALLKEGQCVDSDESSCKGAARQGMCAAYPEVWYVRCPLSCSACKQVTYALHLGTVAPDSNPASRWHDWVIAPPLSPRYPPGAKVVQGVNRRYVLAPFGNLVDERFTVYFSLDSNEDKQKIAQGNQGSQQKAATSAV